MRREQRLRRSSDFTAAVKRGRSWSNKLLVLVVRPNGLAFSRFGFSVGKRVGTAVTRNRVKRRLRELVKGIELKSCYDVVFIARKDAGAAAYEDLAVSMKALLQRAGFAKRVERTGKVDEQT
jgi:ribonuclease P protein component